MERGGRVGDPGVDALQPVVEPGELDAVEVEAVVVEPGAGGDVVPRALDQLVVGRDRLVRLPSARAPAGRPTRSGSSSS